MQTKNINHDLQAAQTSTSHVGAGTATAQGGTHDDIPYRTEGSHDVGPNRNNYDAVNGLHKPVVPPKPIHLPPPYREPPRPHVGSIVTRPATAMGHAGRESYLPGAAERSLEAQYVEFQPNPAQVRSQTLTPGARPPGSRIPNLSQALRQQKSRTIPSRTEAWVQEQKVTTKTERFGSLQQRLRSLLNYSPTDSWRKTDGHRPAEPRFLEEKKLVQSALCRTHSEGVDNPALSSSTPDMTNSDLEHSSAASQHNLPAPREAPVSFCSPPVDALPHDTRPSSMGSDIVEDRLVPPPSQAVHSDGSLSIRDACNKYFGREQHQYWNNYLSRSPYSGLSRNMNPSYDCDKVTQKESIGQQEGLPLDPQPLLHQHPSPRPQQEYNSPQVRMPDLETSAANDGTIMPEEGAKDSPYQCIRTCRGATVFSIDTKSDSRAQPSMVSDSSVRPKSATDGGTSAESSTDSPCLRTSGPNSSRPKSQASRDPSVDTGSDQYKSSSESGRGTMRSSMLSPKSPLSLHSGSMASGGSCLDTSLDSDQSTGGTTVTMPVAPSGITGSWQKKPRGPIVTCKSQEATVWDQAVDQELRQILDQKVSISGGRRCSEAVSGKKSMTRCSMDGSCSESMSVTPPLPPLSPTHSLVDSLASSPKISPKSKYKLSMSAMALNETAGVLTNSTTTPVNTTRPTSKVKTYGGTSSGTCKTVSAKKSGLRRTSSIGHGTSRHWESRNRYVCSGRGPAGRTVLYKGDAGGQVPGRNRNDKIQLSYTDALDGDAASTTTGLDMDSLLEDPDDFSSEVSAATSNVDPAEVSSIRKQLLGLENMYSEILRLLGVKSSTQRTSYSRDHPVDSPRHLHHRVHGSLSSLTGRSSVSKGTHSLKEKRDYGDRRHSTDFKPGTASKRLHRLESHVVTLARSVAHLSSEMRTQHVLMQELENLRRDVTWVQEQLQLMQLSAGAAAQSSRHSRGHHHNKEWEKLRADILECINPTRVHKLTKFFGDEPPLLRQFLKKLGYEKYASNFEAEKIGVMELPYLCEEKLQKIGIPMGPRTRIMQEAQMSFRQQDQLKVYIV